MLDRREPVGGLLRQWRQRRRLSQLDLACDAGISTRHLSFVETGRAHPSRDMLLHLSEQLDVPVRERNVLLVAAGYAPIFPGAAADRSRTDGRPQRDRSRAGAAEALPGLCARPAMARSSPAMRRCRNCTKGSPPISWSRRSMRCGSRCIRRGSRRASSISPNGARICLYRLRRQVELTADRALIDLLQRSERLPGAGRSCRKDARCRARDRGAVSDQNQRRRAVASSA